MHTYWRTILLSVTVVLAGLMFGCSQDDAPVNQTTFEIADEVLSVEAIGGSVSVTYTIEHPMDGCSLLPDTEVDWIGSFDTSVTGTLTFSVSENTGDSEREADVTVAYGDLNDTFKVVQKFSDSPEEPEDQPPFEVAIDEVSANTVTFSVTPVDKEATYDYGAISVSDLNTLPDDMMFVEQYLIPAYENTAAANNMSLEEFLSDYLISGDASGLQVAGLSPETDYYAYAIGISASGEITTDFVKEQFTSGALPVFEAGISVEVSGPNAIVTVSPENDAEGWYLAVFNGTGHDEDDMIASAQSSIEESIMAYEMFFGMPRKDAVKTLTKYGTQSVSCELSALSEYTAAAFSINEDGYLTSNPVFEEFMTGKAASSENRISVEFQSISGRKAVYDVMTTNSDPYVFFTYQYTGTWKEMTDEEIVSYILENENVNSYVRQGSVSSYDEGLREKTEYIIFAFGVSGGVASTELFRFPFTTTEAEMNDAIFSYSYGPYYNGDEAAAAYPNTLSSAAGKVVFPATYVVESEWYGIWHDIYQGDLTDESQYPDEDVYQAIRTNGNTWLSETMVYILDYNQVYTLCGFVETSDGNFGEIYRQVVGPFTLDGCSPIEEFDGAGLGLTSSAPTSCAKSFSSDDGIIDIKPAFVTSLNNMQMGLSSSYDAGIRTGYKAIDVKDFVYYTNLHRR